MAIQWGSPNGGLIVGVEVTQSPTVVSASTTSVTVTAKYYVKNAPTWSHQSWGHLDVSGAVSGQTRFDYNNIGVGDKSMLVVSKSVTVSTEVGRSKSLSFGGRITAWWNGASPSVYVTHTVGARPHNPPATVQAPQVARDGGSVTVTWTASQSPTAPVSGFYVERWDAVSNTWKRVATLPASTRTWTDSNLPADNQFKYRVYAYNSSGLSTQAPVSALAHSEPATPANVQAFKMADGNIKVTWVNTTRIPGGTLVYVYDNDSYVGSAPAGSSSWTHVSPPRAGSHRYKVRAVNGSILGKYSTLSGDIQLLAPPAAPTVRGFVAFATDSVVKETPFDFSSTDGSRLTTFQVRYKHLTSVESVNGQWTTLPVQSASDPVVQWALTAPGVYQWQVRAWGELNPGSEDSASPWSNNGAFVIANKPTATLVSPGSVVQTSRVLVHWQYAQGEDHPQVEARVVLRDQNGSVIEERVIVGDASSVLLRTVLDNATRYYVDVEVKSSGGLWSQKTSSVFTTQFPTPVVPRLAVNWVESDATVVLAVENPTGSGKPSVVSNSVYRSVDGGASWEQLDTEVSPNGVVIDRTPPVRGPIEYRVVAYTEAGASSTVVETTSAPPSVSERFWLNAGDGMVDFISIDYEPEYSSTPNLAERVIHRFAGREFGVEFSSRSKSHVFTVGGEFEGDARSLLVEEFFFRPAPFLYRGPRGERFYVSVQDVQLERVGFDWWRVYVTLERVAGN